MMESENASANDSRRSFLKKITGAAAAGFAFGLPMSIGLSSTKANAQNVKNNFAAETAPSGNRLDKCFQVRVGAAQSQRDEPLPTHQANTDEKNLEGFCGNFSKALPHNIFGEVRGKAYTRLLEAINSGNPADFALITLGGTVKLANPQAGFAFGMEGADTHHFFIPPAPGFESEDEAAEMTEVYWQALTRDIPFSQYENSAEINKAVTDLRRFSRFSGVASANVFRGEFGADAVGPYISQFLYKPIPYGAHTIEQRYQVPVAGDDYMTEYKSWLGIQNGRNPVGGNRLDNNLRYIRNGRDLTEYVHRDFSYQAFLNAALIMLGWGGAALSDSNPYKTTQNQGGFVQFGAAHILDMVTRAALAGLKAAWFQKWSIHRRLRPEEFGGRVHNNLTGKTNYPISQSLFTGSAVGEVFSRFGSYLLPMAYPEGCPTHPAYPAGHATIAGACATMLKAFFKESSVVPNPVVPTDDGLKLLPFAANNLTVGDEINKLASNISIGRDTAGVHWRSDGIEGLKLGEAVAIQILKDYRQTYNEVFGGFSFTKFDGTPITI